MEAVLPPRYYKHEHPTLGTGYARIQDGAGPFVILCNGTTVYSAPRDEVVEIDKEEYEKNYLTAPETCGT